MPITHDDIVSLVIPIVDDSALIKLCLDNESIDNSRKGKNISTLKLQTMDQLSYFWDGSGGPWWQF